MQQPQDGDGYQRASYALPRGALALQFDQRKRIRIQVLAVTIALIVITALSFLVGRYVSTETELRHRILIDLPGLELAWGKRKARGPLDDLVRTYVAFLGVVGTNDPDPTLWFGVERLARAALEAKTPKMILMRDRLLLTLRENKPIDDYRQMFLPQN